MIRLDEEKNITLSRGDSTEEFNNLIYDYVLSNGEPYKFKPSDKITFVVINKKGYTKEEIFKKEFLIKELGYTSEVEEFALPLTEEETELFELASKKKIYWYNIILNDKITIIGYDEEGAKKIIVYPSTRGELWH